MITISTPDGKYFFSSFINLTEETSGQVDESNLQLKDLQYIITASSTGRIIVSEADLLKVRTRITSLTNPGSGEPVDLTAYVTNVSVDAKIAAIPLSTKVDKVTGKGLSTEDFTSAYKTSVANMNSTIDSKVTAGIAPKADKTEVALKLNIPTSISPDSVTTPTVNSVPLYTIGNEGEYVLCTPDTWLLINGFYVPAYSASTVNPPA